MRLTISSMVVALALAAGCDRDDSSTNSESGGSAPAYERPVTYEPPPPPQPTRVVDDSLTIKEGGGMVWRISPGTYRVRVVSSPDGAKTHWSGAPDCQASKGEQKEFETRCIVSADAQLNVDNPGKWGVGPDIIASVIVERLP